MYFYQRIRDLREHHDLTQKEVAKKLSITQPQYALYESGQRELPMHLFIQLADFYDVSLDFMTGRTMTINQSKNKKGDKKMTLIGYEYTEWDNENKNRKGIKEFKGYTLYFSFSLKEDPDVIAGRKFANGYMTDKRYISEIKLNYALKENQTLNDLLGKRCNYFVNEHYPNYIEKLEMIE